MGDHWRRFPSPSRPGEVGRRQAPASDVRSLFSTRRLPVLSVRQGRGMRPATSAATKRRGWRLSNMDVAGRSRPSPPAREDAASRTPRAGRAFWKLWTAGAVSSLGDGLVLVAFPLLALTMTGDPLLIAGVAVADRLPALVLSLPAGVLADRVDRRRLAVVINLGRFALLAIFAAAVVSGRDSLPLLYGTVFLLGAGDMAFDVTTQACLPSMVDEEALNRANGLLLTAEVSGEQFVGPAIGGAIFAAAAAVPFVGDAVSFVAAALLIRRALPPSPPGRAHRRAIADLTEGLRWFFGNRVLRVLAPVVASLAFCQAMVLAELVLYGTRHLHLGGVGYGLFFALGASGNIAGALVASRAHARFGSAKCILGAAVVAGAAYLGMSFTSSVVTATIALFVEAVAV